MSILCPTRVKYRKVQKGDMSGLAKGRTEVVFGDFGLKALDRGRVTARQIEACRVAISRVFKKKAQAFIRVYPDKPITKKPAETRMGKGKGSPDHWVAVVKPGVILFEISGVPEAVAQKAFAGAAGKLGIKTRFVKREEEV